jgi:hypothetical protein|tara:strand:+ start:1396 stop:1752 length:357 start_codon:yes stop_codon:yes gene_type:complete
MTTDDNRFFPSGAQRDNDTGKLRMSLVPQEELNRVMKRFLDGTMKYGENNWMNGMPLEVYYDCSHRHLAAWWRGEDDEDHAAAAVWNILCAMWTESHLHTLPNTPVLDNRHKYPVSGP